MVDNGIESCLAHTSGWMTLVDSIDEKVPSSFCYLYIQAFLFHRGINSLIDG